MLIDLKIFEKIYLYRPFADFRCGIYGLSTLVQNQMELSPFEKYLFIFCNKKRDKLKVLYWDETGFALWYKALEKEKFKWPSHLHDQNIGVDREKLENFLMGLDPWAVPHKKLNYSKV